MRNPRYAYHPIIHRKRLQWPNDARVAFWVAPNIEYFHFDGPIPWAPSKLLPDLQFYTLRDYGSRVGVFRMMEVFDRHGMRASALLNAEVCDHHPAIIEEGNKRDWEWLGHGLTNNMRLPDYPLEEERKIIHEVREKITAATGKAPRGWLGPSGAETFHTPDHLAAEGFDYVCDWTCDDQPLPIRVRSGRMIAVPYRGINDLPTFLTEHRMPEEYLQLVCDHFDTLYREGAKNGTVMGLSLHPYIIGQPSRIKYLDKALEYICAHEGVWKATSGEIADWYYQHYYEDPGPLREGN